jgi:hypothetical protein
LVCGDARDQGVYDQLLDGAKAEFVFTDPPYSVAIDRNVCGLGRIRHREFAMASACTSRLAENRSSIVSAPMLHWTRAT